MAKYVEVKLRRAKNINACTTTKARTMVFAKASFKNIVYTTTKVEDMGQNPVFEDDKTNVFHFVYENDNEYITLELFNRNHTCIGKSRLFFAELAKLRPEQDPEEKTLPVMVVSLGTYQKQVGELVLTAQIKQQQAIGEQGNLTVEVKKGHIERITSIFKSKTTKVSAKLTYKHTRFASGILEGMGNRFMWHEENTFTFIINSSKPDDVLEIEVYNGSNKVGECKMKMSLLIKEEDDPGAAVIQTADLVVGKKTVGSIEVAATFTKSQINQRNSFSPEQPSTPPLYRQAVRQPSPPYQVHPHTSQPMLNMHPGILCDRPPPSTLHSPPVLYPPEQHQVQTGHIPRSAPGPYEPSAPPVMYPEVYPPRGHYCQVDAHGAPQAERRRSTSRTTLKSLLLLVVSIRISVLLWFDIEGEAVGS